MKINKRFLTWNEIMLLLPEHLPSWSLGSFYEIVRAIYTSVRSQYCSAYNSEQAVKSMVEEMRKIIDADIMKSIVKQSKL